MVWLLLGTGIFYSVRLGLPQIRHFGHMFKVMFSGRTSAEGGITPFQALCTGLAAPGWHGKPGKEWPPRWYQVVPEPSSGMWITALVGMATIFGEATLAQVLQGQERGRNHTAEAPAYYLEKGLGQKWMGGSLCLLHHRRHGLHIQRRPV